jgi:hypothetical protein
MASFLTMQPTFKSDQFGFAPHQTRMELLKHSTLRLCIGVLQSMALENKLATTVPTRQCSTQMPKKKTIKKLTLASGTHLAALGRTFAEKDLG